jgi:hypothetical protein
LRHDSLLEILSSALAIASVVGVHAGIIASLLVLKKHSEDVSSPEFTTKFEPLTEGQNLRGTIGRYWGVIGLTRQSILCITLVCLREHSSLQILALIVQSIIMQALIVGGWPLLDLIENLMALFNELMVTVYLYVLITFTGYSANPFYT